VLLRCGDTWRGERLKVAVSGAECNPVVFGAYPTGCSPRPVISGAQPIAGWTKHSGSIWVADLSDAQNASRFTVTYKDAQGKTQTGILGVNQLFRKGSRLPLGRWPNLSPQSADGGYSTVDGHPDAKTLTDNELPASDFKGAVIHLKTMRWLMVNRVVASSSGTKLSLEADVKCFTGSCVEWGYFIQDHLATLDLDGEWHYDAAAKKVYLVSGGGSPGSEVEGSVMTAVDTRGEAGVQLGVGAGVSHVVVENLELANQPHQGIAFPSSQPAECHHLTIRGNLIHDVDEAGVRLASWVGGASGTYKGGYELELSGNTIERANGFGIDTYAFRSRFIGNTLRDIGRVQNLGRIGMGCGFTGDSCTENGDGLRIRTFTGSETGHSNLIQYNVFERTAYNEIDLFGHSATIQNNVFREACITKGDCGAVRTFGNDSLGATNVHDVKLIGNVIRDTIGNTDGCHSKYRPRFGMGLYLDNYSKAMQVEDNAIIGTTIAGISFGRSTGWAKDNLLYDCAKNGEMYASQLSVSGPGAQLSEQSGNVLFALDAKAWTLFTDDKSKVQKSDHNTFFHPYQKKHIVAETTSYTRLTLADWQKASGQDASSKEHFYSQAAGETPRSEVFVNETGTPKSVDLGSTAYLDLDQKPVASPLQLQPYSAVILIRK